MSDDEQSRQDEIQAVLAIYPDIVFVDGVSRLQMRFEEDVRLTVDLPKDYPSLSPPVYELSGPSLSLEEKHAVQNSLNDLYVEQIGQPILFVWIQAILDFLKAREEAAAALRARKSGRVRVTNVAPAEVSEKIYDDDLKIVSGESFTDRKSAFQGHVATIKSKEEAQEVLRRLRENGKISRATHNISAWRLLSEINGRMVRQQDCDDDGETGAATGLLHLLEKMGADNLIVVVSRWYGGIHLGPDRFRHINNAAKDVITSAGLVPDKSSPSKGKKK